MLLLLLPLAAMFRLIAWPATPATTTTTPATTTTTPATTTTTTTTTTAAQPPPQRRQRRALLEEEEQHDAGSAAAAAAYAAASFPSSSSSSSSSSAADQQSSLLLDLAARCHGADGGWCAAFYTQRPLPPRAPPLHGKPCPGAAATTAACSNGLGVCHADTGKCDCPAGWGGDDCSSPDKRPCTNAYRSDLNDPHPASHVDDQGRDLDLHAPGHTYSRCGGVCDADTGACFCDGEAHGRRNAPAGAAPGTPPLRQGRPLASPCSWLSTDSEGKALAWGGPPGVPWEALYGARGWCTVAAAAGAGAGAAVAQQPPPPPQVSCGCALDGRGGPLCDLPTESYCPNQCSGHGECLRGFCRCAQGWYGLDCAREVAGGDGGGGGGNSGSVSRSSKNQEGPPPLLPHDVDLVGERPWLEEVTVDPWSRAQVPAYALVEAAAAEAGGGGAAATAASGPAEEDLALALQDDPFLAALGRESAGDPAVLVAAALAEALEGITTVENEVEEQREEEEEAAVQAPDPANHRRRRHLTRHFWTGAGAGPWRPPRPRATRRSGAPDLPASAHAFSASFGSDSAAASTTGGGRQEWGGRSLVVTRRASATRARPTRLRPRIFVYDMPATFVSRMLQYRAARDRCTWRVFGAGAGTDGRDATADAAAGDTTSTPPPKGLRGGGLINASDFSAWPYATEPLLHELLLRSEHRTLDPEEADFFYVPVYSACFVDGGVFGSADAPWFHAPSKSRVKGASVMVASALAWIRETYPYWDRRKGADHVWLFSGDEGACWGPAEVLSSSLVLSHWGRVGGGRGGWANGGRATALPVSEASDPQLNYTINIGDDPRLGVGGVDLLSAVGRGGGGRGRSNPSKSSSWHESLGIGTEPCHDPSSGRHLVVPAFRPPPHYHGSPFLGAPEPRNAPRDVLLLLMGETGVADADEGEKGKPASFSRGVRQRLWRASKRGQWRERHGIWIGRPNDLATYAAARVGLKGGNNGSSSSRAAAEVAAAAAAAAAAANLAGAEGALVAAATSADADYSRMLARSVFCLVVAGGKGWTGLFEDAVLHGCVPVWMHDAVKPPFDGALRWRDFSLEVKESDAEKLPELLAAVPAARVAEMQRRLALLWHRYAWLAHPLLRRAADEGLRRNHQRGEWIVPALELHAGAARRRPAVGAAVGVAPRQPGDGGDGGGAAGRRRAAKATPDTGAAAAAAGGPESWISPLSPAEAQDDAFATIIQWLYSRMPDQQQVVVGATEKRKGEEEQLPPHRRAVAPWEATLSPDGPTVRQPDLLLESDGPYADETAGGVGGDDPDAPGGGSSGARPEAGSVVLARIGQGKVGADALEVLLHEGEPLLDDGGRGGVLLVRYGQDPQREQREKADAAYARMEEERGTGAEALAAAVEEAGW
jgi:hypothetical protein